MKRCCWRTSGFSSGAPARLVDTEEVRLAFSEHPSQHSLTQLLVDIEQTLGEGGAAKEVPMSDEVRNYGCHIEKHLDKVLLGAQLSRDTLNALGMVPWVGAGLTIIAVGLNMALQMHDNKQQCIDVMQDSLDIWKKVMKPILETKGLASDFMSESIGIILEGYLHCKDLVHSGKWKRFLCASCYKKDLDIWKKKQENFLLRASAVMNADLIGKLSPAPPTATKTSATILVGVEGRKADVMKLLKPEDKEETRVVVLHGMGGVGKSTLAEAIYKQVSVSKERRRCRVEVGEKLNKEHITSLQRQAVEALTGESLMMERDSEVVRDKLRRVLLSETEEPVLIYMDNVFQAEDLEEFLSLDCELIRLPKGSRLLVTTRDVSVCAKIFQRNQSFKLKQYPVKVLNDTNAKKVFFLHAFGQEEPSLEVLEMYDDGLMTEMVSSICGNLPLALRVLGRSLFNTNLHSWRKKYNDLKIFEKLDQGKLVINILKSSFDTLNPETQIAFLMACVCFYDICYADFKRIVESVLPQATTPRLIELGLLERHVVPTSTSVGVKVKIHDLIRNLGYQLAVARKYAPAKRLTCEQDLSDLNDESEVKWLRVPPSEHGIRAELLEKCKEVEIIYLDTHVKGHMVDPPPQLKVVYTTTRLPFELDKLKDLVVLMVGGDDLLQDFPVAASPSAERLQVLHGFGGPNIPREAIDRHKKRLRKLSCSQTAELSPYFCEAMTELQELLLWNFQGERLPEEMGSLKSLETLVISSTTIQELPQSLAHFKQLQHLQLQLKNLKEIPRGVLGGMKEVAWLQLWHLERVTYVPMQEIAQLASLEDLEMILPCAERLTDVGAAVQSLRLQKLKRLYLWCDRVSSVEGLQLSCPSLECLILVLEKLEVLPSKFITGASKLESLYLANCNALEALPAETEMLKAIETLAVVNCPAFKAIPEGCLQSVESLALLGCTGVATLPVDLDGRKAGSMRLLTCDTHLLPPNFLSLPSVLPYTPGDRRVGKQLHSFFRESFFLASNIMNV